MKTKTLEEENNIEETIWKNAIKEQFGEDVYTSREIKEDFQKKGMTKEEIKESFTSLFSRRSRKNNEQFISGRG